MSDRIAQRLQTLGVALPTPAAAAGAYAQTCLTGTLLFVSGQLPMENGVLRYSGSVGTALTVEEGQAAARLCALNILAQAAAALGTLDRVRRVVRLNGFVSAPATFTAHPQVINGASELLKEVFGDAGVHTRIALGVSALPLGAAVEADAIFEVA